MGILSCNAESAIQTCDSYNFNISKTSKPHYKIRQFTSAELFSATNNFSDKNLLGKGSHGYVYKAHLDNGKLVAAVKKTNQTEPYSPLHSKTKPPINSPSENEIEVLSRVRHARLVNLLGYSTNTSTSSKLLVVEFMPNGTLYEWLHGSSRPVSWAIRIRFAMQVAKAVRYLHCSNPPVIHRDIKSSNILIDEEFNARLGDFGLALRGHVEDVRVMSTPPAGTLGYLDPGYLVPGDLSVKSDVFSFGILLLEIISGRNAIDMNYSPSSVVDWAVPVIKSGDFSAICDPRIGALEDDAALMQLGVLAGKCVRPNAVKRPGMLEVVEVLKNVYKRVNSKIWNKIGRRVGECTRAGRSDVVEENSELLNSLGNRRNSKVSSVTSVPIEVVNNGSRPSKCKKNGMTVRSRSRSRSIDSIREVGYGQLDESNGSRKTVELVMKMSNSSTTVRLRKSMSTGMLQSAGLINKNEVKIEGSPIERKLEKSKLLIDLCSETLEED